MTEDAKEEKELSWAQSMAVPIIIALVFLAWGAMIFFTVGNKGPYHWYYGSVEDVPAQSAYSTAASKRFFGSTISPQKEANTQRQHVMGETPPPVFIPEGGSK